MDISYNQYSIITIPKHIPAMIDPFIPVTIDGLTTNQIRTLLYGYIHQIMHDDTYIHKVQEYKIGQTSEYGYSAIVEEIPGTRCIVKRFIRCVCQNDHNFDYIF